MGMNITADKVKEAGNCYKQLLEINKQIKSCQYNRRCREGIGYKIEKVMMFLLLSTIIILLIAIGLAFYNAYQIHPDIDTLPDWQVNDIFTNEVTKSIKNSLIAVIIVAFPFSLFSGLKVAKKDLRQIVQKHDELKIRLEDIIQEKKEIISIIPEKYRYPLAANFFAEVLENGRADSMKEAMNLYEEQLHRWKMENKMEQILKNQQIDSTALWTYIITDSFFR